MGLPRVRHDLTTKQEQQRLGMEGIWQVEKDVLDFMFHRDYVASFRCFKTSESILLPSRSSASPLNSHRWSHFHAFVYAALSAHNDRGHPNSSNTCSSLLVQLSLLIFQDPALRFPLGRPASALLVVCCYLHFPWGLLPIFTSVSFSRLRAP